MFSCFVLRGPIDLPQSRGSSPTHFPPLLLCSTPLTLPLVFLRKDTRVKLLCRMKDIFLQLPKLSLDFLKES